MPRSGQPERRALDGAVALVLGRLRLRLRLGCRAACVWPGSISLGWSAGSMSMYGLGPAELGAVPSKAPQSGHVSVPVYMCCLWPYDGRGD